MIFVVAFGLAFLVSALLTPLVRRYAIAHDIVDRPDVAGRKIHSRPVAYLGGVAIFVAFLTAVLACVAWVAPPSRQLLALLLGCLVLVAVGVVDDKRGLSPWTKLVWQVVAAGIALAGGIGITVITNPFGGVIDLTWGRFAIGLGDWQFHIMPIANALTILWLVGMANTINFLDGLDGLASGVSGIAAVVMFVLALSQGVNQPMVALLAIAVAGAAFGFLPYNFYPARIFMGDSGAYFLGLVLAMLAVYSGAKLATAALVLGVPIADTLWTILRRLRAHTSPFRADRRHFHHLLLEAGLSQRQAVLTLYVMVSAFGVFALLAGALAKLMGLVVVIALMGLLLVALRSGWHLKRPGRQF